MEIFASHDWDWDSGLGLSVEISGVSVSQQGCGYRTPSVALGCSVSANGCTAWRNCREELR